MDVYDGENSRKCGMRDHEAESKSNALNAQLNTWDTHVVFFKTNKTS